MSRDDASLLDIVKAARLLPKFTQGMTKEAFLEDPKTQSASLHQLMVIGAGFLKFLAFRKSRPQPLRGSSAEVPAVALSSPGF
jgi:uncharacterized protein with HEPN domain